MNLEIGSKFRIKCNDYFHYEIINFIKNKEHITLICHVTAEIDKCKIKEENHSIIFKKGVLKNYITNKKIEINFQKNYSHNGN